MITCNSNKLVVLIILGIMIATMSLFAEDMKRSQQKQGPPDVKEIVSELTTELSLSADQAEKITKIYESHISEMKENREKKENVDRETMRTQMEENREKMNKEIIGVLDKKQKKLYKKWIEDHKPNRERSRRSE